MTSSLGVGDPEDLSKKLSSILSLIPEKEESAEKSEEVDLKTPPVRKRVPRKPKLEGIEELAIRTVRRMPKITITEESPTPRKFFKSKDKTDVENSPPNMVTPTIKAPSAKKQSARTKSKSTTPDEYNMVAADLKPVSRSLKNIGKIQIFDDSQFKTPVKSSQNSTSTTATKRSSRKVLPVIGETETPSASSSAKKSTRSSARKTVKTSSEEAATEGPSREGSVRKSARKTKTEEAVTPTVGTRSSRRALNRL